MFFLSPYFRIVSIIHIARKASIFLTHPGVNFKGSPSLLASIFAKPIASKISLIKSFTGEDICEWNVSTNEEQCELPAQYVHMFLH